jgi:hypothetical protein
MLDLLVWNSVQSTPILGHRLIGLERWLQENCPNIIDESDEVLDTKFKLFYTVGNQQTLDGHSDRWEVAQALLVLVERHAEEPHL